MVRPTDFPGVVINPSTGCVVDEVEISVTPVKTCECFTDCTDPGSPPPILTECFIYGPLSGNLAKGCPAITDEAFGLSLGILSPQYRIAHSPLGNPIDFLQAPGATDANTALRFNLYLGQPITGYEVVLVDDTGKRASMTFAPASGSVLEVTLPLDGFTLLDVSIDFTAISRIYFILNNNAQPALCMMALDNIRVCTNVPTPPVFSAAVDALPYGDNQIGDVCTMIEDVPSAAALARFTCGVVYPPPPAPPQPCDSCFVAQPLVEGTGSVMFKACAPGVDPPLMSIYFPAPRNFQNDFQVTVFTNRAGMGGRIIVRDVLGRRGIYNYILTGGNQLVNIGIWAGFSSLPDGMPNATQIAEVHFVFGTDMVLPTDVVAVDAIKTNFGTVMEHNCDTTTYFTCGYNPEPGGPGPQPNICDLSVGNSPFTLGPRQMYRVTFNDATTIHTVSRMLAAPVDLGASVTLTLGLDVPVPPNPAGVDAIEFVLYDDFMRRAVFSISPLAIVGGPQLFQFTISPPPVGRFPDEANLGRFNFSKVIYWGLAIERVSPNQIPPFTVFFDGFRTETIAPAVVIDENFTGYTDLADFETNFGGEGCFDEWRMAQFNPTGMTLDMQVGWGSDAINSEVSQPAFLDKVGLFDMGAVAVTPLKTIFVGKDLVKALGSPLVLGAPWDRVTIRYQAHPDSDARVMELEIIDASGFTMTYAFTNGDGSLAAGFRDLTVLNGSFTMDGPFDFTTVSKVRLFAKTSTNAPVLNPLLKGQAEDQFHRSEVALSNVAFKDNLDVVIDQFDVAAGLTLTDAFISGLESFALDMPSAWNGHAHLYLDMDGTHSAQPAPFFPFFFPGGATVISKHYPGPTAQFSGFFPAPVDLIAGGFNDINVWAASEFGDGRPHLKQVFLVLFSPGGTLTIPLQFTTYPNIVANVPGPNFTALPDVGCMDFPLGAGAPAGAWDPTNVISFQLLMAGGMSYGKVWIQHISGSPAPFPAPQIPFLLPPAWDRTLLNMATFSNPPNQFTVGKKLDPNTTPLVALNCDLTKKIAYWGQSEDTIRAADLVMVPAKYRDDPIVGVEGNYGLDGNGDPLPGVLEALARDMAARYGFVSFVTPPFNGCRNIWMDIVYIDAIVCLGVYATKNTYTFFETECGCPQVQITAEVSDLITDRCLDRLLPDDQFQLPGYPPLPGGYPEALSFEYCALPDVDVQTVDDTSPNFTFMRETASCARPEDVPNDTHGHYWVRVSITAKVNPLTVFWQDVLQVGEVLVQGTLSDNLVFTSIGQTIVREYLVRTAQVDGGSAQVAGSVTGIIPATLPLNMLSPLIDIDANCDTLAFFRFGSQNPNVFGQVFYAGGGRFDPVVPSSVGLYVTMWMGQGSPNMSKREQLLTANVSVPALAASADFLVADIEGFAVGLPVWVFNGCFVDNPVRRIMCLDIEEELAKADPNEEVTGLYGTVTAIDPVLSKITVAFYTPPNQIVDFTTMAKAEIMIAPDQSMGFYWEASPKLVDIVGHVAPATPPFHAILRWSYRFWNSTQNPAPCAAGAAYICDGDGQSRQHELHGDLMKDIINPVDWIDLWCSPVREIRLEADGLIGQGTIAVCDICPFEPCDIIQIVDANCTGREGNGPGLVVSVVQTAPFNMLEDCAVLGAVKGTIQFLPIIPAAIDGCGLLDTGFTVARRARVFKKPDIARYAYSPTLKVNALGQPIDGAEFVGVDFETGTFTFDPMIVVKNPCTCYKTLNDIIQLPTDQDGIYYLVGVDKSGCKSPPSKPIKVSGIDPPPPDPGGGGIGQAAKLLAMANVTGGGLTTSSATVPPTQLPGSSVSFTIAVPSRIKFEASLWQFNVADIGDPGGNGDADAFAFLELRDTGGPTLYPLANRHNDNSADPQKVDVGAGSAMIRVLDLPAGSYTFDLTARAVNADGGSDNTVLFISVYPLTFLVWNLGAL